MGSWLRTQVVRRRAKSRAGRRRPLGQSAFVLLVILSLLVGPAALANGGTASAATELPTASVSLPSGSGAPAPDLSGLPDAGATTAAAAGPQPHFSWSSSVLAQATNVPAASAGLQQQTIISIPNWTTTGPTQANFDLLNFDPVAHVMYLADRVNHGVDVINTQTNTLLGTIIVPSCVSQPTTSSCPSGVLVAPDLRRLVVTDRLTGIFIYDITAGPVVGAPIASLTLPSSSGADEMDYDPLNKRVFIGNTNAPFFETVVDLTQNAVLGQIPVPESPEQIRFNPVDGLMYLTISGNSTVVRIDPTQGIGTIVATIQDRPCAGHGLDIDAETNIGLLGCSSDAPGSGQGFLDLTAFTFTSAFPQVTGTDVLYFDPHNRRWYTASSSNLNVGVPCPQDNPGADAFLPVVGVFAAGNPSSRAPSFVGVQCSGRNSHGLGVDPYQDNIYVPARQFPTNPASLTTGQTGVVVFHDPAPAGQPPVTSASASLTPFGGGTGSGSIFFARVGGAISATASVTGVTGPFRVNITTTVGNETLNCTASPCTGTLLGDPLIGGVVLVGTDNALQARGTIATATAPTVPAQPAPPSSGTAGTPCAGAVGQTCTATGGVTGTWTKTGSGTFTFTATGPAGTAPLGVPRVFIPTTVAVESFLCTAVPAAPPFTTTCTGTTAGDPLQGATITVRFPLVTGGTADVTGTITGPGPAPVVVPTPAAVIVVSPPQQPPLPPLPPPLLPPPPFLPPSPPMMAPPQAPAAPAYPEVPVIPEADSLFLLIGGLAALGGLAGLRRLRRRER